MRILVAEDDVISRRILVASLRQWGHDVVVAKDGDEAWRLLQAEGAPSCAILDWMMPGMDGIEICRRVRKEVTDKSIYLILLTAISRKEGLIEGLEAGADDYVTKPFDRHELRVRLQAAARIVELQESLRQRVCDLEAAIIERQQAEEALRKVSLTDHLTGLYNHRGFFNLAEHHARLARRTKERSLLIYGDMDGLKTINDTLGHNKGSQAIAAVADILRRTFRDGDIVARLGGDEFAVLAPNIGLNDSTKIVRRLQRNLDEYNQRNHEFHLSLSVGMVEVDHDSHLDIEEQIAQADRAMYRDKRGKKGRDRFALV
ncbi:MAG TPA: diguanylate cyclase [Pyrinomonadaceae bacterium]|nr:diguanylate cyclase [Pyrinomonadaceae bacterium]